MVLPVICAPNPDSSACEAALVASASAATAELTRSHQGRECLRNQRPAEAVTPVAGQHADAA